jgi:hypothetical protein
MIEIDEELLSSIQVFIHDISSTFDDADEVPSPPVFHLDALVETAIPNGSFHD